MSSSLRRTRLESLLQREISEYLIKEIQNPNIGFTSVLRVEMNRDLTHAKVFVSIMGSERERTKGFGALKQSAKFIQYLIGKNLRIRNTPILRFVLSDSLEEGDKMAGKLESIE